MEKGLRATIETQTYFTKEAAEYLGISVQRLNQLVQARKITPIKRTSGAMLFIKEDLDLRKEELRETSIQSGESQRKSDTAPSVRQLEATAYFTIQSFLNYSDKKTSPVYESLYNSLDFSKPITTDLKEVGDIIGIPVDQLNKRYEEVAEAFQQLTRDVVILKREDALYPPLLRSTNEAPPFIFARGNITLLSNTVVAVVGTRHPSDDGARRAYKLSRLLGNAGIVVSSGLAHGIDTQALRSAMDANAPAIAVIGTPISRVYPKENKDLQEEIANKGLVISQFGPNEQVQRWFFPLRNGTMSAISRATVIVEAGETSGALKQADYAIKQGRLIFIPQSAIDNPAISWPKKYIKMTGAHSFQKIDDLLIALKGSNIISNTISDSQIGLFDLK